MRDEKRNGEGARGRRAGRRRRCRGRVRGDACGHGVPFPPPVAQRRKEKRSTHAQAKGPLVGVLPSVCGDGNGGSSPESAAPAEGSKGRGLPVQLPRGHDCQRRRSSCPGRACRDVLFKGSGRTDAVAASETAAGPGREIERRPCSNRNPLLLSFACFPDPHTTPGRPPYSLLLVLAEPPGDPDPELRSLSSPQPLACLSPAPASWFQPRGWLAGWLAGRTPRVVPCSPSPACSPGPAGRRLLGRGTQQCASVLLRRPLGCPPRYLLRPRLGQGGTLTTPRAAGCCVAGRRDRAGWVTACLAGATAALTTR